MTVSEVGEPPDPRGAVNVEQLIERLRLLQVWSGKSYRTIHREVVRSRTARGVPERPVLNTVYRCFQPGRARLDVDLVVDIAGVLLGDEQRVEQWRQACWVVAGLGSSASIVSVSDSWPDDLPSFVGRRLELRAITEANGPGWTITGMPGVGKTRLAVRAGHLLMADGRRIDARLAVDLRGFDPDRPPADPGAVLEGFLRRLGMPGSQIQHLDVDGRAAAYRRLLADRNALVLLDNAASAEQVRPLLADGPDCRTLITSRRDLPGLPVRHMSLDVLAPAEAIDLLSRADERESVDAEPDLAVRIAELLGYLPLALALVGSRIGAHPDWTLTDHLDRLQHHRHSLRIDGGVEVAISLSYRGLPADQQRAIRLLALHPGRDITPHAAMALIGTDLAAARHHLDELTAANLLQRSAPDRYRFHDLIRIYATSRAHDEDPARAHHAALTRLSDHYLHTAVQAADLVYPYDRDRHPRNSPPAGVTVTLTEEAAARRWLDTELTNLLAVATTHPTGLGGAAVAFSTTLHRHLTVGGHYADAGILHRHAAAAARQNDDPAGEAVVLIQLGDVNLRTGQYAQAIDHLERALALSAELDARDTGARALFGLGVVYQLTGRYDQAVEHHRNALARFRAIGNRAGEARALGNLGVVYQLTGRYEQAIDHGRQVLAVFREVGAVADQARALDNLGISYALTGRHDLAAEQHEEALTLFRQAGDVEGQVCALDNLGNVHRQTGRYELAAEHHRQAIALSREIGDRDDEARALNNLGLTCLRMGRYREAMDHHGTALTVSTGIGDPEGQAKALNGLGEANRARGDLSAALTAHARAHQHASKIGHRHEQARADFGLGHVHRDLGDAGQARDHWQEALALFEELGVPDADEVRARLAALDGDKRAAG